MKKYILSLVCLSVLVFPVLSFAQSHPIINDDSAPSGLRKDLNQIRKDARGQVREERKDAREDVKDIRRAAESNIKDTRRESVKNIKAIRATTTEAIKKNRQEMMNIIKMATTTEDRRKSRIELKKDFQADRAQKIEEMKISIKEEKNALKEKLKVIKDQRKQQVVERIDERINSINEVRTNRFLKLLEKFEDFLDRISARADLLEKEGKNVSSVRTAVSDAESAITASRSAIEEQAKKIYKIVITTEGNLGNDVSASVKARQNDLKTVGETVRKAHEAIRKALSALKLIGVPSGGVTATTTSGE